MKTISRGVRNSTKILIAFVLGQVTQLIIQGVEISFSMWDNRRIPFALAAGFIILFAVIMGVRIAAKETAEVHRSYKEYANEQQVKEA